MTKENVECHALYRSTLRKVTCRNWSKEWFPVKIQPRATPWAELGLPRWGVRKKRIALVFCNRIIGYSVEFHMMKTIEEIIEQARRLSPQDRQRLIEQLEELLGEEQTSASVLPEGPYAQSLALAGTAHTDFTDVSPDKYKSRRCGV